jgi:Cdc6-like AAA superfamily ATPase
MTRGTGLNFSFPVYARAIARRIAENPNRDLRGFVVGITGPWGSGKTTLMESILARLAGDQTLAVKFNAWAHSKQEAVWRDFFMTVVTALRRDVEERYPRGDDGKRVGKGPQIEALLDDAERALYRTFVKETPGQIQINATRLAKLGTKLAVRFIPWGDIGWDAAHWLLRWDRPAKGQAKGKGKKGDEEDEDQGEGPKDKDVDELWGVFRRAVQKQRIERVESMEQFREAMTRLLASTLEEGRRLVVAIDDVDRCLPEQGLEVLEAIKLYLDLPGASYLVAMDQEVLQHALDLRYRQTKSTSRRITAEQYAEKMIDLTFVLPAPDARSFERFVAERLPLPALLKSHLGLLRLALPANPRTWERFAHRAALNLEILKEVTQEPGRIEVVGFEKAFLKLQLLTFRWPSLHRHLLSLDNLLLLESCLLEAKVDSAEFRKIAQTATAQTALKQRSTRHTGLPDAVWPFLDDNALLRFLVTEPHLSNPDAVERAPAETLNLLFALDMPNPGDAGAAAAVPGGTTGSAG